MPLPPWLAARMADYLAHDPPARRRAYRAAMAEPGARRGPPPGLPGDSAAGLHRAVRHGRVLQEPAQARPGSGRPTREHAGQARYDDGNAAQPAVEGVRLHDLRHTFAALQLSAGVHFMQVSQVARPQHLHAYPRRLRRLDPRAGRRRAEHPARAGCPHPRPGCERRAATEAGAKLAAEASSGRQRLEGGNRLRYCCSQLQGAGYNILPFEHSQQPLVQGL